MKSKLSVGPSESHLLDVARTRALNLNLHSSTSKANERAALLSTRDKLRSRFDGRDARPEPLTFGAALSPEKLPHVGKSNGTQSLQHTANIHDGKRDDRTVLLAAATR